MSTKASSTGRQLQSVTPYLIVHEAPAVAEFAKQAFGAEELHRSVGSAGGFHIEVRIADSLLMIGGGNQWRGTPNPTGLHLYVPDTDAVYRRALQAGAVSVEEPVDQLYRDREAGVRDPGGNLWWIATRQDGDYIPEGLHAVTPFLHIHDAARFIDLLAAAFDGQTISRLEPAGTVVHAVIRIGDSALEVAEAHDQWQPMPTTFFMNISDADVSYRRAVAAGMKSIAPPAQQSFGARVGTVADPFGNTWYLASPSGETHETSR